MIEIKDDFGDHLIIDVSLSEYNRRVKLGFRRKSRKSYESLKLEPAKALRDLLVEVINKLEEVEYGLKNNKED